MAIDAGHGGVDLGAPVLNARGEVIISEAEINLALTLRLRDLLDARGYRVVLTRDDDRAVNEAGEDANGDGRVTHLDELQARIDLVNEAGADLFLSIHQNAYLRRNGRPDPSVGGTVTLYCAHRSFSDLNLRFAEAVQGALVEAFNELGHDVHDRGVQEDLSLVSYGGISSDYHLVLLGPQGDRIVRPSEMPAVLSETLFVTHMGEVELAQDPAVLDRLARAYADAVDAYFAGTTGPSTAGLTD
ncbi:MAG: N-acetylmuramoyl-L-alanine amidase family protein [Anaerolineae bacterium]